MIVSQPAFLKTGNIYEVNIRQYTPEGTFNAFGVHLPRLRDMGVEILWFMPVHPIGELKRKGSLGSYYSIKDHEAVNPEFGTAEDLKVLISAIHLAGMKIIIDWVANHTAWDHVWTISHPDFFVQDDTGNFKPPYDWDDVIQIDHLNKEEQKAMTEAMQFWIKEYDIDGFRADLAHLTPLQFWMNARTKLTPLKKDLIWLAETEDPAYHEAFDISYAWKWMHETENFVKKGFALPDLINVLKQEAAAFPCNALRLFFTSNHDENSWNGTEYEKYNNLAKAFAVFSFTYYGVPLIYSGQELPNKKRLKFFDKDVIEWGSENEMHDFYKTLIACRKRNAALFASPDIFTFSGEDMSKNILAYSISSDDKLIIVLLNMGQDKVSWAFSKENMTGNFRELFTGDESECSGSYLFTATPGEYAVLEKL